MASIDKTMLDRDDKHLAVALVCAYIRGYYSRPDAGKITSGALGLMLYDAYRRVKEMDADYENSQ